MGIFDALLSRPDPDPDQRASAAAPPSPSHDGRASLERRRDELVAQVAELHWDLGGLTYEMAIRDHFRLDVLVRRAAELQERDAELGELERVLSLQENAGAGACPDCGAVHARGALYCWQCGKVLMERVPSAAANGSAGASGQSAVTLGETAGARGEPAAGHGEAAATPGGERAEAQTMVLRQPFDDGESSDERPGAPVSSGLASDASAPAAALPPHPPIG